MPWTAEPYDRGPTRKTKDVALVQPGDGRDPEKDPFARGPVLHLMSPAAARALAAELVRAADEVEPVTERSCFTCVHCPSNPGDSICEPDRDDLPGIGRYLSESGCYDSPGGMPTNRSIPCPGHAPKVTT